MAIGSCSVYMLRKIFLYLSAVAVVCAAIPLQNGSFEDPRLEGWTIGGSARASVQQDRTEKYSGAASIKISNLSPRESNVFILLKQRVPVVPLHKYRISAWVKGSQVSSAGGFANAWIGGGVDWGIRQVVPAGTYSWRKITRDFTTGEKESAFELLIAVEGPVEAFWVDDVSIEELENVSLVRSEKQDGKITDGGFETDKLDAWTWSVTDGTDVECRIDKQEKHSGGSSLFLTGTGAFGAGRFGRLMQRVEGLVPGKEYEISMWVKSIGEGSAGWYGGGPGWTLRNSFPVGTYDWQRVATRFRADASSTFEVMLLVTHEVKGLWIDDVKVDPAGADDKTTIADPAVWDVLPASAGFYPVLDGDHHELAPMVRLQDAPRSAVEGGVRVTYDRHALHFEFMAAGVSGSPGIAMLTVALPGENGTADQRQRFSFRTDSDGMVTGRALVSGQEWLSAEVVDERPFDWSRARLAAKKTVDGYVTKVSLPWSCLAPVMAQLPVELGVNVVLSADSADGRKMIGRWVVPSNDDARGRETLARLILLKDVPSGIAWLKMPSKARSSQDALVGQYWEYAFAGRSAGKAGFEFISKAGRTIDAEENLTNLAKGQARMVSFRVPGRLLDEDGNYQITVRDGTAGAAVRATGVFARLSFGEQVIPRLDLIKRRLEVVRARLNNHPEMNSDSYVVLGLAVAERFVERLDDVTEGRLKQREEWSVLQVEELGQVMGFLEERAGRTGSPEIIVGSGGGNISIENGVLMARDRKSGESRPVYAYGYGHFGTAAKDLPFFAKTGASLIEQERGPHELNEDGSVKPQTSILRTLDQARAQGMKVDLLLSPHYFPEWALAQNPELRSVRAAGFIRQDIDHPKARWVTENWIRGVMEQVGGHPALFSVGLSNEPMWTNSGHDPVTRERWVEYLRRLHGDVTALNKTYGSSHANLEDVPVDEPDGGLSTQDMSERRRYFDWIIFNQENFANWHRWMNGLVKESAPGVPTHVKIMPLIFSRSTLRLGVDPELIAGITDFVGNDAGTPLEGHDGYAYGWHEMELWYDLLHSFNGRSVYNSENHLIRDNSPAVCIPAAHTYASLWQGALHNLAATAIWVWEPTGAETSLSGSIYMRPANILAAGRVMLDVNRLAEPLGKVSRSTASVAILYSISSIFWNAEYMKLLIATHEALTLSGHQVTFVSERQLAEGRRSSANRDVEWIVLPQATHVADSTVHALGEFARNGGNLIAIGEGNLTFDPYNHVRCLADDVKLVKLPNKFLVDLAGELRKQIPEADPLLSEDGSEVTGVEYREVKDGDNLLVSLTNMRSNPVTIRLPWSGATVRDLIGESNVAGREMTLAPMVPVLLEVINTP